jgi:hypothetical protein
MAIIKNVTNNFPVDYKISNYTKMLQIGPLITEKDSNLQNFLDHLYTYPPKFKVKWDSIDELNEDLFTEQNYGVLEHSFPFVDFIQDFFFRQRPKLNISDNYNKADLKSGILNKNSTSNFYQKQTRELQQALVSVPVFVILNGYNEIVLSKPQNPQTQQTISSAINKVIYETCGTFDPMVEKRQQLGFFFLNRLDAETYLNEVITSDTDGTKTTGVSIHCIGLDSAYEITREYHPGIDFRLFPDLRLVKNLLHGELGKKDLIVDDQQQQLRFRRRRTNLLPSLGALGRHLSPTNSFLQRNEYFKGVPIFIVQATAQPRSIFIEQYYNILGVMDTFVGRFTQNFDYAAGLGHNWIMQGSLANAGTSPRFKNYVFFDKADAEKFIKEQGRKIARYSGSRTSNVEHIVRKPKLFVYNLEDFLELWEENIQSKLILDTKDNQKSILDCEQTYFIPASTTKSQLQEYLATGQQNITLLKKFNQTTTVKFKKFKSFLGIFFGVGYS